jgi:hypothetical protein
MLPAIRSGLRRLSGRQVCADPVLGVADGAGGGAAGELDRDTGSHAGRLLG